jgi:hypothetical protein
MDVTYNQRTYRLPDFLIIGLGKCGTTTLAELLNSHPEVGMSAVKEPHFFSYDYIFERGIPWYATLFNQCRDAKIIGEASTSYSRIHQHPDVHNRIYEYLPGTRIIMMVRHPMDRIISAYIEWLATPNHDQTYDSINEALTGMSTFIEASRYWKIYNTYKMLFGDENIHVVWFDDLIEKQHEALSGVCRFIGVEEAWLPAQKTVQANARVDVEQRAREFGRNAQDVDLRWNQQSRDLLRRELEADITGFLKHFKREDLWSDLF